MRFTLKNSRKKLEEEGGGDRDNETEVVKPIEARWMVTLHYFLPFI